MTARRKTRLWLTQLENRDTPATMNYTPGIFSGNSGSVNLYVSFTASNAISWSTAPATTPSASAAGTATLAGNLKVSLMGSTGSTGNNITVDLAGQSFGGNLTIQSGSGNDTVSVINGTINGAVQINTFGGNDVVNLGGTDPAVIGNGLYINSNLKIQEGKGDDSINFIGGLLSVASNTTIGMGAGNNGYSMASLFNFGGNFTVQAGTGNDLIGTFGVAGSVCNGFAYFNVGNGSNSLNLPAGLTLNGITQYVGGNGTDVVTHDANVAGLLAVSLKGAADSFSYLSNAFVGSTALIDGGPGTDVYSQAFAPGWSNILLNFP